MTTNIEDLFGEGGGGVTPAPVTLEQIKEVGKRAVDLTAEIEVIEEVIKAKKKDLNDILQAKLPMMMVGAPSITLDDGTTIKIGNFVSGSLPKDPEGKQAAIDWLEANEGGDLVKAEVSVAFTKQEYERAKMLLASLNDQGLPATIETGVHAQTLAAFVRERIENGDPVDTKVLGVFIGRHARLTKGKPK